jgi:hypothetical protein
MGKTEHKHEPGLALIDPSRLQIKQCIIIKLANGSSMAAFYIIGKDLELRLGIHFGIISQKNVVILLVCKGSLGFWSNINPSVECTGRHLVKNSLEKLVAGAIREGVVDIHKIIDMLPLICKVKA